MFQSSQAHSITGFIGPLSLELVDLCKLRHHEDVDPVHLRELKEEIRSDRILKFAIAVDINTNIILDGEHRFNALKELGCKRIPVVFIDYESPEIAVRAWRQREELTKKDVIEAGFSRHKLPPTTTKHMVRIHDMSRHISAIEKRVNVHLKDLRGGKGDCC